MVAALSMMHLLIDYGFSNIGIGQFYIRGNCNAKFDNFRATRRSGWMSEC